MTDLPFMMMMTMQRCNDDDDAATAVIDVVLLLLLFVLTANAIDSRLYGRSMVYNSEITVGRLARCVATHPE